MVNSFSPCPSSNQTSMVTRALLCQTKEISHGQTIVITWSERSHGQTIEGNQTKSSHIQTIEDNQTNSSHGQSIEGNQKRQQAIVLCSINKFSRSRCFLFNVVIPLLLKGCILGNQGLHLYMYTFSLYSMGNHCIVCIFKPYVEYYQWIIILLWIIYQFLFQVVYHAMQ